MPLHRLAALGVAGDLRVGPPHVERLHASRRDAVAARAADGRDAPDDAGERRRLDRARALADLGGVLERAVTDDRRRRREPTPARPDRRRIADGWRLELDE